MEAILVPSQPDREMSTSPPRYTTSPVKLWLYDIILFIKLVFNVWAVILPVWPGRSCALNELAPTGQNLFAMAFLFMLFVVQAGFIISIPFCSTLPLGLFTAYFVGFIYLNQAKCLILNGWGMVFHSSADIKTILTGDDESWIFINGVWTGRSWLQSNIDRLALTFRRPVIGIHNLSYGPLFDLIECGIQRDFDYATKDTRTGFRIVREHLVKYKKVVLILHSQGGIEGSQILDWLFENLPHALTSKLEVYTFGCAANHFNNPVRSLPPSTVPKLQVDNANPPPERVIRHIEHYANSGDPVSKLGVLHYIYSRTRDNRFVGKLFERTGTGHLLNQHYLSNMFTLDSAEKRVLDNNPFMDSEVDIIDVMNEPEGVGQGELNEHHRMTKTMRPVKELSRLWKYRNGKSPED